MTYKYNPFTHKLDLVGSGTGGGDVNGPGSSTDNAIVRWDGVSGTLIQNSVAILSDAGDLSVNSIDLTIALAATDGGTGQTSYTTGDLLYASSASALSKLPIGTNSQVLTLSGGLPSWQTPAASGVTSVSGTTDRITSTGGTTPVIDIAATYVGQTSITTLGTIATGTWNATTIAVTKGGTGLTSASQGDLLYGSAANTYSSLAKDTNSTRYLSNTGSSNNPAWAQVALSTGVSGQLPLANGGTNANLTASNGGIFYSSSSAGAILAGTATANQVLLSGASTTPAWSTATYPATVATGDLLYASTTNTLSKLSLPTFPGQLLIEDGSLPIYYNPFNQFIIDEEFTASNSDSTFRIVGGGSGGSSLQTFVESGHPGVWGVFTNGAGANWRVDRQNKFIILGGGLIVLQTVVKIPVLSDGTNRFTIRIGFGDDITAPTDGVYFLYQDNVNSGKWECRTTSASTTTATDSGITTDTNWHNYTIIINSNASSVTFYIDGSLVATNTTNIPSVILNMGVGNTNGVSNGTSRYFYLDRLYLYQKLTSSR
jgi:hypothetical protein